MRSLVLPSHNGGMPPRFQRPSNSSSSVGASRDRVGADQFVGADRHGLRALGGVAHRDARHAHHGGLFGHAARIGDHRLRVLHQVVEFQIRLRLDEQQVRRQRGRVAPGSSPCADAPGTPPCMPRAPRRRWLAARRATTARESTFAGRCIVITKYWPARRPQLDPRTPAGEAAAVFASSVSIIVLPTKKMRSSATPAWRRFWLATSLVVKK